MTDDNLDGSQLEGIFFDLDGTLNDSEWLGQEAYSVGISSILAVDLTEDQKRFLMGKPFSALFSLFHHLTQEDYEAIVEKTLVYTRRKIKKSGPIQESKNCFRN